MHAKLAYNWYGSWTTLYNLFADSMLCFHVSENPMPRISSWTGKAGQALLRPGKSEQHRRTGFVSDHIYKIQSDWYHIVMQKYGLPLDSRHLYTKSDWEFFAAAVASKSVRGEILDKVASWVNETSTGSFPTLHCVCGKLIVPNIDRPLTDLYETEGEGGFPGMQFKARPVVGGHFAFVALERACDGKAMDALRFLHEQ